MSEQRRALYVRLPTEAADTLDRVAGERRISKQDLVADLIVGRADFRKDPSPVLTVADAAELLQVAEDEVIVLAVAGELPGRKIGTEWRFSREVILDWLKG